MLRDCTKFVRNCDSCQKYKPQQQQITGKMHATNVKEPWESVSVDLVCPQPRSSNGNIWLLVMQDKFTKWVELECLKKANATAIARAIKDKIILRFGQPSNITSDNGRNFVGKEMTSLLEKYGISHRKTPPYSPQCNTVERANRVIKTMMAQYTGDNHKK
ncbi:hypothetical protein TKK_0002886 [Trichogramma kaykai]|uniref:Integrase catalytic domain-containing protein n=1 Tax=Trichogramma kaykai TaxID=54128 RepID=A0ABD2XR37_9HYME